MAATILRNVSLLRRQNQPSHVAPEPLHEFLPRELFARMLFLERKRTERSGRSFVLMLLDSHCLLRSGSEEARERVLRALCQSTRDTDTKGWYKNEFTIGVIFTELGPQAEGKSVVNALLSKVTKALSGALSIGEINEIRLSFHVFPDDWDADSPVDDMEASFYDDLLHENGAPRPSPIVKRSMDIAGSLLALTLGLPLFLALALAIRLTSRGPVLFRQQRLGQYGRKFVFLKFRSMYLNNDETLHRDYVRKFVSDVNGSAQTLNSQVVYKMVADPRVTPVGRFLRKTSLDEFPQFLNVLKGEMSLVGPRPPLPYEVDCYEVWHKTRMLAARPGITGLWQVAGRSRVKFDDMVRMDLRYASRRSLWMDLGILLRTPQAVFSGAGAH